MTWQTPAVTLPSPIPTPAAAIREEPCPKYPETSEVNPHDIAYFIDQNPEADLVRLWQRLGVPDEADSVGQFTISNPCGAYEAKLFQFNLDSDPGREFVLQIKQQFLESYTYLVFDDDRDRSSKLIGTIDVWAKYPPADPVVLLSNDRAWLILQATAATGSGVGAWLDHVYEVSERGFKEVGSYLSAINQFGSDAFPTKAVVGHPVSCELKNGRAILKISYTVEYSGNRIPLFTKQKTAVLVGLRRDGASVVDVAQSEITPRELETIYNYDSMNEEEFMQYNLAKLRAIAAGNDLEKKRWLKEFLDNCDESANKRALLQLLQ